MRVSADIWSKLTMNLSSQFARARSVSARATAVAMLFSLLCGLMAPAAVAMTSNRLEAVASDNNVSGDVRDFFSEALEDALLRNAVVAPIISGAGFRSVDRLDADRPAPFLVAGSLERTSDSSPDSWDRVVDEDIESSLTLPSRGTEPVRGP